MDRIDLHADDFALSLHSSEDILSLLHDGVLDSISIMPNMSVFDAMVAKYKALAPTFPRQVMVSIHLNFMEGHAVAPMESVLPLVDERGFFRLSWGDLFFSHDKAVREALTREIIAQIERVKSTGILGDSLRIDSHQHTHMTAIVFAALQDAIKEKGYKVNFIRLAEEPLMPFFFHPGLYRTYPPLNLIKQWLLYYRSLCMKGKLRRLGLSPSLLWGLVLSGDMDSRVMKIYPDMKKKTKSGRNLEILFHPGSALPAEIGEEFVKPGFVAFHLSPSRHAENVSVRALSALIRH